MKKFVIDNSVVVSWLLEEEHVKKSREILNKLSSHQVCVPSIWPYELANALFVAEKRNRIKEADSVAFICDLKNLPIIIEDSSFERIGKDVLSLSREHKITVYDASYIELALREDLALASFDKEIIKICKKIGVVVI